MDANEIKEKVLRDFDDWLQRASYGRYDDYSHILHMISFVEAWNEIDSVEPLYQYFLYAT